jgi:hypothetical protein
LQDGSQAGLQVGVPEAVAVGVAVEFPSSGISLRFSTNPMKLCVCEVIEVLASPTEPCTITITTVATSTLPPIIRRYSKAP